MASLPRNSPAERLTVALNGYSTCCCAGFGHADIGFIGGLFLMTNNIIG